MVTTRTNLLRSAISLLTTFIESHSPEHKAWVARQKEWRKLWEEAPIPLSHIRSAEWVARLTTSTTVQGMEFRTGPSELHTIAMHSVTYAAIRQVHGLRLARSSGSLVASFIGDRQVIVDDTVARDGIIETICETIRRVYQ